MELTLSVDTVTGRQHFVDICSYEPQARFRLKKLIDLAKLDISKGLDTDDFLGLYFRVTLFNKEQVSQERVDSEGNPYRWITQKISEYVECVALETAEAELQDIREAQSSASPF